MKVTLKDGVLTMVAVTGAEMLALMRLHDAVGYLLTDEVPVGHDVRLRGVHYDVHPFHAEIVAARGASLQQPRNVSLEVDAAPGMNFSHT